MTRLMRILGSVAVVLALAAPAAGQGALAPIGVQLHDNNGDPCNLCVVYSFAAGTTTPLATYADAALGTSNGTSVTLDASGRANIYLSSTLSYKLTLRTAAGVDIWTRDGIVGPLSGVISAQAANTRGIQVSRTSADAGISIASIGGSGKTYGLVSNTSGGFRIQDDSDSTPRMEWLGDNITATMTGAFAVAGNATVSGTLGVTGATTLGALTATTSTFSGVATHNAAILSSSVSPAVQFIETDAAANTGRWSLVADGGYLQMQIVNDAGAVTGSPLYITRSGSTASVIYLDTPAVANTGRYNSATLQPGFLAYNSAIDGVATGGTVDFDTEVYDETGNFAGDSFAAPVAGRYHFCAVVQYSDNSASSYALRLLTSARAYQLDWSAATSAGVSSGCVYADMAVGHIAYIQVLTGDVDIDIEGGASPMVTYFSGRLVP